jgi:methylglyoxal reductase
MKYTQLGNTDIEVSAVSIGTFGLGGGGTWSDTQADKNTAASLLDAAVDVGINLIDTAPVYGLGASEEMLSYALRGRREQFILQTKCALNWRDEAGHLEYVRDGKSVFRNLSAQAIVADLEQSLKRLGTDYVDVYITHRQSDQTPVEETMGALLKLIEQGKIRAAGISNASTEILGAYHGVGHVALVQEKFSMLTPDAAQTYIPACERFNTTFQVYASLEAGALTGREQLGRSFPESDYRSRNKWFSQAARPAMEQFYAALEPLCETYNCSFANLVQAWTLAQSPSINLLIGVRRVESLINSAQAADIELDEKAIAAIDRARAALFAQTAQL